MDERGIRVEAMAAQLDISLSTFRKMLNGELPKRNRARIVGTLIALVGKPTSTLLFPTSRKRAR
jgi:hypothetical protein